MLGIASKKVCVIATEIIKQARDNGDRYLSRNGADEISITLTKLMWMPGVKPVMMPIKIPMKVIQSISINIFLTFYHPCIERSGRDFPSSQLGQELI